MIFLDVRCSHCHTLPPFPAKTATINNNNNGINNKIFVLYTVWMSRKIPYPDSQWCLKVMEDEMWVLLRHGANVWNVMAHHNICQGEICCWAIGKVTYHHCIWITSV